MKIRVALTAMLTLLAGCTPRSDADRGFVVRDSAGVQIAESTGPLWQDGNGWALSDQPVVSVGVVDGDPHDQFTYVSAGLLLPGGGFAVLDGRENTLRAFSEDGAFLWEAGGPGDGPGEFGLAWSMEALRPDSLLVFDRGRSRVLVFTADGRFARSFPLQMPGGIGFALRSALPAPGRTLLVTTGGTTGLLPGPPPKSGMAREEDPLLRARLEDGALIDTLGVFPGMEWYVSEAGMGPPPFGKFTTFEVRDSTVVAATGDDLSVTLHSMDGTLTGIVRVADADLTVTDADMQAYRDAMLGRIADEQARARYARLLEAIPKPERRAAYASVMVDPPGDLWLPEQPNDPLFPDAAHVFSPEGRYLGMVTLPERFRPLDVGTDRLLGTWMDDLDVPHVGVWKILR